MPRRRYVLRRSRWSNNSSDGSDRSDTSNSSNRSESSASNDAIFLVENTKRPLTFLDIQELLHLPLKEAAQKIGLSPSRFKKKCRLFHVLFWPSRRLSSLHKQTQSQLKLLSHNLTEEEQISVSNNINDLIQQMEDIKQLDYLSNPDNIHHHAPATLTECHSDSDILASADFIYHHSSRDSNDSTASATIGSTHVSSVPSKKRQKKALPVLPEFLPQSVVLAPLLQHPVSPLHHAQPLVEPDLAQSNGTLLEIVPNIFFTSELKNGISKSCDGPACCRTTINI